MSHRFNISGDGKRFKCVMIEPGIVSYLNTPANDVIVVRHAALADAMPSIIGKHVTVQHVSDLSVPVPPGLRHGVVDKFSLNDDGSFSVEGDLFSDAARDHIRAGWQASCGYAEKKVVANTDGRKYHGLHYDKEVTALEFHHLAIVPEGRYENAEFRLNSARPVSSQPPMFKFLRKIFETRTNAAGASEQVQVDQTTEVHPDATIEVGGKPVRLNALVEAATAPASVEIDGKMVLVSDLIAGHKERLNAAAEAQKKAEADKAKAEADAAEQKRLNAESFAQLQRAAQEKIIIGDATSSDSREERLKRGNY